MSILVRPPCHMNLWILEKIFWSRENYSQYSQFQSCTSTYMLVPIYIGKEEGKSIAIGWVVTQDSLICPHTIPSDPYPLQMSYVELSYANLQHFNQKSG